MISEVKKHHGKTFVVLNWESSKEKLLIGYSILLKSDSSILSSFSLYAIVLYCSFSLTFQTLLKTTGWLFFLLNLVLDSIVQKDVIIRESTVLTMEKKAICKNCGDNIGSDSNSNEFCSEQCGVEYRLEHK